MLNNTTCEQCKALTPINGFGGYLHYPSTKKLLDKLVQEQQWEVTHPNSFEAFYKCCKCGTVWILAKPDFPACGYFLQK